MEYIDSNWSTIFAANQLGTFDSIWELDLPYVDSGNYARGGRSMVSRHTISLPNGKKEVIYIKRQENYTCFNWRNPFLGRPTYEREFDNWKIFKELKLPTYELLYFAKRWHGKNLQAILISKELPAQDLGTYIQEIKEPTYKPSPESFKRRKTITSQAAKALRQMHDQNLRHGHMIPKHIFVEVTEPKCYLIDLEILRKSFFKRAMIRHDIGRLARHLDGGSLTDKMRFFKCYFGINHLTAKHKRLWRAIHSRASRPKKY
jgi:hypothetical protein